MSDCLFCKIINKELPSTMVYEDEYVCAFNDIHPEAPVHVLVVPKKHIASLNEINEENADILVHIHLAAKKVAEKLGISEKGFRLINNCGSDGGQTIFHIHYHVLGGVDLGPKIV
jgi:histidine triad (HIT) family protein